MARKKRTSAAFTPEEAYALTEEIMEEGRRGSDRGVVLVSAAVIDEALRRSLQSFMVDAEVSRDLLAFNSPLGTLSSRIQMSEALGLITAQESKCLHLIRSIRNDYAHEIGAEINSDSLADRMENLRVAASSFSTGDQIPKGWNARSIFTAACINMVTLLTLRLADSAPERCKIAEPIDLPDFPFKLAGG